MRKIVTKGLFTHIEGVFSGTEFGRGVRTKEARKPDRARGPRKARAVAARTPPAVARNNRKVKDSRA